MHHSGHRGPSTQEALGSGRERAQEARHSPTGAVVVPDATCLLRNGPFLLFGFFNRATVMTRLGVSQSNTTRHCCYCGCGASLGR